MSSFPRVAPPHDMTKDKSFTTNANPVKPERHATVTLFSNPLAPFSSGTLARSKTPSRHPAKASRRRFESSMRKIAGEWYSSVDHMLATEQFSVQFNFSGIMCN